jgi:cytochrome P450
MSLQWGLIELAKRPDIQTALRNELREKFLDIDPTWEQLTQEIPLLDAVIHETLRLHPSIQETVRQVSILACSSCVRTMTSLPLA